MTICKYCKLIIENVSLIEEKKIWWSPEGRTFWCRDNKRKRLILSHVPKEEEK